MTTDKWCCWCWVEVSLINQGLSVNIIRFFLYLALWLRPPYFVIIFVRGCQSKAIQSEIALQSGHHTQVIFIYRQSGLRWDSKRGPQRWNAAKETAERTRAQFYRAAKHTNLLSKKFLPWKKQDYQPNFHLLHIACLSGIQLCCLLILKITWKFWR